MKNKLENIYEEIEKINQDIGRLFLKRLNYSKELKDTAEEMKVPYFKNQSLREIVSKAATNQNDEMASLLKVFFNSINDLEKSFLNSKNYLSTDKAIEIKRSIETTEKSFPKRAVVACQGIEGSNSQLASEKMFLNPDIIFFNSFDAVFTAVEKGLCKYGMLPIENSLNGSVSEVYELMKRKKFYIVKSVKMQINHTLLGKKGSKIDEIKDIYSHSQALGQCSEFFKNSPNIKAHPIENTAIAAKFVSEQNSKSIGAISTKECAELYNLEIISTDIQNNNNNYTRFICISKNLEIYPGANKTSLMFTTPNKPGALYGILSKFSALGVNLTKLESRIIPGMDFESMFYVDLDSSVYSDEFLNTICELESGPETFVFLGSYLEI